MPFNLYAGPVAYAIQTGAGIVINTMNICDIGSNQAVITSGNLAAAVGSMVAPPDAANENLAGTLILPRSGCALLVGTGASGGNFSFKCVAQQGP